MSEGGRVFGLDLLRAFAILCVVYSHGSFLLGDAPVIPRDLYMIPVFDGEAELNPTLDEIIVAADEVLAKNK